jgi:Transcription factor WhiB
MITDEDLDAAALRVRDRLDRIVDLEDLEVDRYRNPHVGVYWRRRALCEYLDGDWFTIGAGNRAAKRHNKRHELAICAVCPVSGPCLTEGMTEKHGIWGGLLPSERDELRRQ